MIVSLFGMSWKLEAEEVRRRSVCRGEPPFRRLSRGSRTGRERLRQTERPPYLPWRCGGGIALQVGRARVSNVLRPEVIAGHLPATVALDGPPRGGFSRRIRDPFGENRFLQVEVADRDDQVATVSETSSLLHRRCAWAPPLENNAGSWPKQSAARWSADHPSR